MTKYIPRCSCIICKEEKSSKGIHSHFLSMHTDAETKKRLVGNKDRKQNTATCKQKAIDRAAEYNKNPKCCLECNNTLPYSIKHQTYCSGKCSAIHTNAKKDYTTIKTGPPKGTLPSNIFCALPHSRVEFCMCEICNNTFTRNSIHMGSKRCCTDKACIKQFGYNVRTGKTGGYHPNSTRVHKSIYKGYQMDSGAELVFAQLCDLNNIEWIKNKDTFFEFNYPSGKVGKYYPDFYLPHISRWIEIKGRKYIREFDSIRQASANAILIMSDKLKDIEFILDIFNGEGNR